MVKIITLGDEYESDMAKGWKTSMQQAFSYVASFPPSVPATFINMFSDEGQTILDPFAGSGTSPLQALIMKRDAIGNDMSLVAYTYCHARLKPISYDDAMVAIEDLKNAVKNTTANPYTYRLMLNLYHPDTLQDIIRVREYLKDKNDDASMFLKAFICSILYGGRTFDLTNDNVPGTFPMNIKSLSKFAQDSPPKKKDLFVCLKEKIRASMMTGVPERRGKLYYGNALDLATKVENNTVDLVVTSPPYINMIMYGEKNWVQYWFLGEDYTAYDNKTKEVGSCSGDEDFYFGLMKGVLKIAFDKLRDNTACVFVVGGSKADADEKGIMHIPMRFAEVGKEVGFEVNCIITREFESTFRGSFSEDTKKNVGTKYQDASVVFFKGNPVERMNFGKALRTETRPEVEIDDIKIDLSKFGIEDK
jgi:DNA modification methylase